MVMAVVIIWIGLVVAGLVVLVDGWRSVDCGGMVGRSVEVLLLTSTFNWL